MAPVTNRNTHHDHNGSAATPPGGGATMATTGGGDHSHNNNNSSESAAEFVMTVRTDHVAMKEWYNTILPSQSTLKQQYGAVYPDLWKEVLNWPGWKETRRAYLQYTQLQQSSSPDEKRDLTTSAAVPAVPPPRKRQSRWGNASASAAANNNSNNNNDALKRGRWRTLDANNNNSSNNFNIATANSSTTTNINTNNNSNNSNNQWRLSLPTVGGGSAASSAQALQLQAQLRDLNAKLEHVQEQADKVDALPRGHADRSPSPPPMYGPDGKRQNTRAVRWKERYTAQRQGVLEQLLQLSSSNGNSKQLASLFRPTKKVQKITIPVDKHPNYNFIGLIIGPRGKTQKELEAKTGCKIAIRGKGSVKEGARGRRDGQADPGDYEPLHVVVTGDDPRAVDAAATMIQEMLVVLDDERNVHKQQQLRELALLNGTLKDDETIYCPVCAEKGHRAFECPQRLAQQQKNRTAAVQCAICGETSHPTRDCKQQPNNNVGGVQQPPSKTPATSSREMDSDYQSFLAELEGGKPKQQQPPTNSSIPQQPHKDSSLPLPPAAPLPVVAPPPPILGGGLLPPPAAATLGLPPPPVAVGLPPPPVPGMENPAFHDRTYYSPANANAYPMQSTAPQLYPPAHHHHQPPHAHHQPQYQHHYPEAASNNYPPPHQSYNNAQYPPPQLSPQEQQQQQQPQYQQVQPGQETATWDPNAYYGSGGGGGGNGGGLNWWEQ